MKNYFFLCLILISSCSNSNSKVVSVHPPTHQPFTVLLNKYVKGDLVDYQGLKSDSLNLNNYIEDLSEHAPSDSWSENERLAYWINAYNAFTLKLIIDNYPINSITELHPTIYIPMLNTVWHKKFFKISGVEMSLDEIEHKILRKKFNEPRIHFAINCASISCPPLRNEAYESETLDSQLKDQAILFINDKRRNEIGAEQVYLSKIFNWFKSDFTQDGDLIDYLNQYSEKKIDQNASVDYLKYDWRLNDLK